MNTNALLNAYQKGLPNGCSVETQEQFTHNETTISFVAIRLPIRDIQGTMTESRMVRLIIIEGSKGYSVFRNLNDGNSIDANIESINNRLSVA